MHVDVSVYIYLSHQEQANQSHCYNAQCGYVHLNPNIPVDGALEPVSTYNGQIYAITLSIYQVCMTIFFFVYLLEKY